MENRSLVIKKKNGTFNPKFRLYSSTKIAKRLKNRNNQVTKNYILYVQCAAKENQEEEQSRNLYYQTSFPLKNKHNAWSTAIIKLSKLVILSLISNIISTFYKF